MSGSCRHHRPRMSVYAVRLIAAGQAISPKRIAGIIKCLDLLTAAAIGDEYEAGIGGIDRNGQWFAEIGNSYDRGRIDG